MINIIYKGLRQRGCAVSRTIKSGLRKSNKVNTNQHINGRNWKQYYNIVGVHRSHRPSWI